MFHTNDADALTLAIVALLKRWKVEGDVLTRGVEYYSAHWRSPSSQMPVFASPTLTEYLYERFDHTALDLHPTWPTCLRLQHGPKGNGLLCALDSVMVVSAVLQLGRVKVDQLPMEAQLRQSRPMLSLLRAISKPLFYTDTNYPALARAKVVGRIDAERAAGTPGYATFEKDQYWSVETLIEALWNDLPQLSYHIALRSICPEHGTSFGRVRQARSLPMKDHAVNGIGRDIAACAKVVFRPRPRPRKCWHCTKDAATDLIVLDRLPPRLMLGRPWINRLPKPDAAQRYPPLAMDYPQLVLPSRWTTRRPNQLLPSDALEAVSVRYELCALILHRPQHFWVNFSTPDGQLFQYDDMREPRVSAIPTWTRSADVAVMVYQQILAAPTPPAASPSSEQAS